MIRPYYSNHFPYSIQECKKTNRITTKINSISIAKYASR